MLKPVQRYKLSGPVGFEPQGWSSSSPSSRFDVSSVVEILYFSHTETFSPRWQLTRALRVLSERSKSESTKKSKARYPFFVVFYTMEKKIISVFQAQFVVIA